MRTFDSGATRDSSEEKLDYEGYFSPLVLEEFAKYMYINQKQADGKMRDSDNWQKGIPLKEYMKSLWRHFFAVWKWHRGHNIKETIEQALCGLLFNSMGYLHEILKNQK